MSNKASELPTTNQGAAAAAAAKPAPALHPAVYIAYEMR